MYRKFTASQIFDGYSFLPAGQALITAAGGEIIDSVPVNEAGEDIEHLNGILTPGFINCHCHAELSHMKGIIAERTGLADFVQQVMALRGAAAEQKQQAIHDAAQEMYSNGIVAVGDICNTTDAIAVKQSSKIIWSNFIEVSGFVDAAAEKRFTDAKLILEQYKALLPTQHSCLSPHAPYSVSKTLFQLLNQATAGKLITIHNQESAAEDKLYLDKTGDFLSLYKNFGIDISAFEPTAKSSLQSWLPYFTNKQSVLLVHDVHTKQTDIDAIKLSTINYQLSAAFCLCPAANLYIENKLPGIELFQKNNMDIVLGTDSYASNHQLSIWEEIKVLQAHFPAITLQTLLQWATSNGAKAMQLDATLGSFEKGKTPGLVLIEDEKNIKRIL